MMHGSSHAENTFSLQSLLLDAVDQAVIATDLQGNILYWNRFAEKLYGWRSEEVLGRSVLDVTPAEQSAEQASEILSQLKQAGSWSGEITLRRKDGATFPAFVTSSPVVDSGNHLVGIVGVSHDISEQRAGALHNETLLAEQAHRVKNMLAVVQSLARQTAKRSSSKEDFLARFHSRLSAVAAANDLLIGRAGEATTFEAIARATLNPLLDERERIGFNGPALMLPERMILPLSMLLHELCTNAMKYGALSSPAGAVDIIWRNDASESQAILELEWRERGGPAVAEPQEKSFGSALIERAIAQELRGQVSLEFPPDGVRCLVRAPL